MIEIIPYEDRYQPEFYKLNIEWLDKYNLTESHDLMILDDPEGEVIDKGGYIFMAEVGGKIVGSAGLMKEHQGVYELIKMAVTESYRGKGIARLLIERCLYQAREIGAQKVTLFSNHQLQTAISLYAKYGFQHTEVVNAPMETADVRMELIL